MRVVSAANFANVNNNGNANYTGASNSNGVRPDSSNLTNGEGGAVHSPDICGDEWQSQMRFTTVSIA